MASTISVLYGTETGNSEYCADQLSDAISAAGFDSKSIDMEDFSPQDIQSQKVVFIVTSTYGNGGPPFNAEAFLDYLQSETIDLSGVHFAVCGLGDSSFDYFNQCGKDFEKALLKNQAKPMFARVDCDTDYEEPFEAFQETAIQYLEKNHDQLFSGGSDGVGNVSPVVTESVKTDKPLGFSKDRPFLAPLVVKKKLSQPGSAKETMHYELDLTGASIPYRVGDCFGVCAHNQPDEIQAVLSLLNKTGSESVEWNGSSTSLSIALQTACLQQLTKDLLSHLGDSNPSGSAAIALKLDADGLERFRKENHVVDVLKQNNARDLSAQEFISALRKLQPRLYSVASSPTADPNRVAFVIETLRYTWNERDVQGVASCWLADRMPLNTSVPTYLVKNDGFLFPTDDRPVIMVGPGTGIAPFRAYLHELKATGRHNKTWLFFGHQHEAFDYLYREEIESFKVAGVLNRVDFAWSRDQAEKVYVQDRIASQGRELWQWLQQGASVYVCGDAIGMAPGVAKAFADLAKTYGGVADGRQWVEDLKSNGRYLTDVY